MKGKLTIVALVVLAVVLTASPVLAVGSGQPMEVGKVPKKQPTVISMTAKIKQDYISSSTDTGQIYVAIQMTNKAFIQYRGEQDWVKITDNTLCLDWVKGKKSVRIDCSDLGVDDKVSINAKVDPKTKVITARRVQRKQPRIHIP